jgi:hypothetical protein
MGRLVANAVREDFTDSDLSLKIETQLKIPDGYEIRAHRRERELETHAIEFTRTVCRVDFRGRIAPKATVTTLPSLGIGMEGLLRWIISTMYSRKRFG